MVWVFIFACLFIYLTRFQGHLTFEGRFSYLTTTFMEIQGAGLLGGAGNPVHIALHFMRLCLVPNLMSKSQRSHDMSATSSQCQDLPYF